MYTVDTFTTSEVKIINRNETRRLIGYTNKRMQKKTTHHGNIYHLQKHVFCVRRKSRNLYACVFVSKAKKYAILCVRERARVLDLSHNKDIKIVVKNLTQCLLIKVITEKLRACIPRPHRGYICMKFHIGYDIFNACFNCANDDGCILLMAAWKDSPWSAAHV